MPYSSSRSWKTILDKWLGTQLLKPKKRRGRNKPQSEELEARAMLSAGTLDPSFGDGGKVLTEIGTPTISNGADIIAYQEDGKAIVVGDTQSNLIVARYNDDGSLDTTFGTDGIVSIDFGSIDRAAGVAVDSVGRILVAGNAVQSGTGFDFAVARLTASGALDTTFAGNGKQTVDFSGSSSDLLSSLAVDSVDRVLLGGYTDLGGGNGLDFAVARLTISGALDTSFDGDGKQTVDFAGANDFGYGVGVDNSDRVLLVGNLFSASLTSNDFAVARLTVTGALDSSFDGDGKLTFDFNNRTDIARDVTVDSAGRILIGGESNQGSPNGQDFAVARLLDSGALDTSFNGNGKQTVDFGGTTDLGFSVAVDSTDRVLIAGRSRQGGATDEDFAVARLTASGAFDTTFDGDGKQTIDFNGNRDEPSGVAVDSAGRILIAGDTWDFSPTGQSLSVARLTDAGTLDTSFDGDGMLITTIVSPTDDNGRDVVAFQSDGKSIVVGTYNRNRDMLAVRYNTDGSLDTTFGSDGIVQIDFSSEDQGYSVAVDSQDRILVAGYSRTGSTTRYDFAVARLTPTGALDTTFAGDGKQTIDFGSPNDFGYSVAVDSQDRVILGGRSYQVATNSYDFAVARLTTDGVLDTSFNGDGKQTIDFGGTGDEAYSVEVDSQDRVVVGGFTYQGGSTGYDFAVARLTTDGLLDTDFDNDGRQTVHFGSSNDRAYGVAIDSQDRVLLGGHTFAGGTNGYDFAVSRLTTSGSLDLSFDGDGRQTIHFGTTNDRGWSVAVDGQDRALVAGYTRPGGVNGFDFAVTRLTIGGTLDASFAEDGKQTIDFGSQNDVGLSVAVDAQGRILIAGDSNQGTTRRDLAIARLLSNQPPIADDATFDVVENADNGTLVGAVTATDPNNDALSYSIRSGNDLGAFAIDAGTGQISVADSSKLDYESATKSFTLEVQVDDGQGGTDTAFITINLLNQASITGTVFVDTNLNGLFDGNEMGIDGVTIELLDTNNAIVASTVTSDGGFYLFEDFDPGTYRLREIQPTGVDDGAESLGNLGGSLFGNDVMELILNQTDASDYDFAEHGQQVTSGDAAGIGFWQNKHGQSLIAQGGSHLAQWLSDNFGNVFGGEFVDEFGLADVTGDDVASFYKDQLFKQKAKKTVGGPAKVDAQFMAVALATYFTSRNLAGDVATPFGFNVTDTGIGTKIVDVGTNGAAFQVADHTDLTIMQLLSATNHLTGAQSGFSSIYDVDGDGSISPEEEALRTMANNIFSIINDGGGI